MPCDLAVSNEGNVENRSPRLATVSLLSIWPVKKRASHLSDSPLRFIGVQPLMNGTWGFARRSASTIDPLEMSDMAVVNAESGQVVTQRPVVDLNVA